MPLPLALVREVERVHLNRAEQLLIRKKAALAGLSVSNYLRSLAGLPERPAGRPTAEQLGREADDAWDILRELGEDPKAFFPATDEWTEEYPHEK